MKARVLGPRTRAGYYRPSGAGPRICGAPVTLSQGPGNYGNSVHLFVLLLWFLLHSRFAPKNRNSSVIYIISCLVTQFQKIREVAEIEME